MMQIEKLFEGAAMLTMKNGDVLITQAGAAKPFLCVEKNQHVRIAFSKEPVDDQLAAAARDYVARHSAS